MNDMKRRIKEQSSMFAHSNFKSSKDGGRSPFEKDSLPLGLDTALDDDFTEEEWAAFEAELDQRLSQPRKPLSPGAQKLRDKSDEAEWEWGSKREGKSVKITKQQLQAMITESVNEQMSSVKRYPELEKAASEIRKQIVPLINKAARETQSEMPYKAQHILEELIKQLEELV